MDEGSMSRCQYCLCLASSLHNCRGSPGTVLFIFCMPSNSCCCPSSIPFPVFTLPAGQGKLVTLPRAGCQRFPGHESLEDGKWLHTSHLHLAQGSGASRPQQQSRSGSSSFPWCKTAPQHAAQWFVFFTCQAN